MVGRPHYSLVFFLIFTTQCSPLSFDSFRKASLIDLCHALFGGLFFLDCVDVVISVLHSQLLFDENDGVIHFLKRMATGSFVDRFMTS